MDNTQSPARTMKLQNSENIYAVIDKSRASPAKTPKVGSMSHLGKIRVESKVDFMIVHEKRVKSYNGKWIWSWLQLAECK